MPGDPNECRKYAHRCTELAAETTDTDLKNRFTDLAAKWTQLAIDLEDARARNRSATEITIAIGAGEFHRRARPKRLW
jgi:hypothetical protein